MRTLPRPAVMGIVNVTPDSFSDGGRYLDPGAAIDHGLELAAAGADVIDVGGESSRPGALPVPADVELARVVPVVRALAARAGVPVSVDTTKAAVAAAALDAGASIVNDISAGRADPGMLRLVAAAGAGYVVMHMAGTPATMQIDPRYDDVVSDVTRFLAERLEMAVAAGVEQRCLIADPGIGFGKTAGHNLELLAGLPVLVDALEGVPVLVGTSRKSFLGGTVDDRDDATLVTVVWCLERGAAMVRVHDVRPAVTAARLVTALAQQGEPVQRPAWDRGPTLGRSRGAGDPAGSKLGVGGSLR
ncbi:MAG: dihydropteroate synthase [Acidimicrobiia bacterium]